MNCSKAQKIPIKNVFASFSLFPSKENSKTAFYFAIDRDEKTPSLSVDFIKNTAFDFGTGKKYDVISIVQMIKKCSVSDALKYLKQFDFSFQKQTENLENLERIQKIIEIKKIEHPALLEYLKSRRIEKKTAFLNEVHYQINGKKYFGIGFKNDSNGYEVRNKYSKVCIGKKDVTIIKNNSQTVRIFEGFFDYLSFAKIEENQKEMQSDYIILNSVSMVSKLQNQLESYEKIELYFDNDNAGNKATENILELYLQAKDCRESYKNYKDLNEYLVAKGA